MLHHIGISGGKDSTALLLWARYESGYDPKSLVVSFCDTGNEAAETYDYVAMLSEKVHPVTTIKPERDFWELAKYKKRFPSARARFCTQHLKMEPARLFVNVLREIGADVLMHSGVRASESADRAKLPEREFSIFFGCELYRPLLKWTIEDVWAIHKRHGIEPNPLYAMGYKRVGCLPCVMSRKSEIASIAQRWPEKIDFIEQQENFIAPECGYSSMFHRKTVPLRYRRQIITAKEKKVKAKTSSDELVFASGEVPDEAIIPAKKMAVASIRDVVEWAVNDAGEGQITFDDFDFFDDAPGCDSRYGACE